MSDGIGNSEASQYKIKIVGKKKGLVEYSSHKTKLIYYSDCIHIQY